MTHAFTDQQSIHEAAPSSISKPVPSNVGRNPTKQTQHGKRKVAHARNSLKDMTVEITPLGLEMLERYRREKRLDQHDEPPSEEKADEESRLVNVLHTNFPVVGKLTDGKIYWSTGIEAS